jgi:predicted metal-dependent hydrolase
MYSYPVPYLAFLAHFHIDRDYFECHELLEEHWKATDGARDSVWVGLIQSAVYLYHYRRGNANGATRMAKKAMDCFSKKQPDLIRLGIDADRFTAMIQKSLDHLQNGVPFAPLPIPIADKQLADELDQFTETFQPEPNEQFLVEKHKLRDRSDVIEARELSIQLKKAGKVPL